ncbi:MAG: class I SAM-dependent methyltransferase, partial [Pseudomonadota bacterium]|nr:class I SAM-dependent methyltransferase [Pseudomonadota bacterium]
MAADLEFTGERFLPGIPGSIAYEHGHRYAFALRYVAGKRVLDAACGEGYGAALLAGSARRVYGVDLSAEVIGHARGEYRNLGNLQFEAASVATLPLADASVDVVVSFETIEHLPASDQPLMLAEFSRVLAPGGLLIVSSPNRLRYTDARAYHNPFHLHELYRHDLERLLAAQFPAQRWFHQSALLASALWSEDAAPGYESWLGDGRSAQPAAAPDGMYYLVLAAKSSDALPHEFPGLSTYHDRDESELARVETAQAEVLRLDALLRERDAAIDGHTAHVRHLEELVAYRDRVIVERDGQLAQLNEAMLQRQHQIVAAHEQVMKGEAQIRALEEGARQAES